MNTTKNTGRRSDSRDFAVWVNSAKGMTGAELDRAITAALCRRRAASDTYAREIAGDMASVFECERSARRASAQGNPQ